jgi:hypothetical protein
MLPVQLVVLLLYSASTRCSSLVWCNSLFMTSLLYRPCFLIFLATQAARAGLTKYTGVTGTAPLRQAICDDLLRRKGTAYTPAEIVVSNGAKQVCLVVVCGACLAHCLGVFQCECVLVLYSLVRDHTHSPCSSTGYQHTVVQSAMQM